MRLSLAIAALAVLTAPGAAHGAIKAEQDSVPIPPEQGPTATATATCPAGSNVVSGGWRTTAAVIGILQSRRVGKRSWRVTGYRLTNNLDPSTLTAYAYCDTKAKRSQARSARLGTNPELEPTGVTVRCPRGTRAVSGGFQAGNPYPLGVMTASHKGKQRTWRARWLPYSDIAAGEAIAYCGEAKRTRKRAATDVAGKDFKAEVNTPRCPGSRSAGFRTTIAPMQNPLAVTTLKRKGRRWLAKGFDPEAHGHSLTAFAYCPRR